MAIKIVLTDEDALAWAAHAGAQPIREAFGAVFATEPQPFMAVDLVPVVEPVADPILSTTLPEQNSAGTVVGVAKRGRGRPPTPKSEAGPVIPLPVEDVTDADPLLDIGAPETTSGAQSLVPSGVISPVSSVTITDDLDLGGPLTALVEYSDAEMHAAAAKFVLAMREPGNRTFRLILGKYATQVADIPQDRRGAFLHELTRAA